MPAYILFNGYLPTQPILNTYRLYAEAAKRLGIDLRLAYHTEFEVSASKDGIQLTYKSTPFTAEFVLSLDKDLALLRVLEQKGIPVYNSSQTIALCDDKWVSYALAAQAGIRIPRTIHAPMRYHTPNDITAWATTCCDQLGLPLIIKECFGSYGEQVHLCPTHDTVITAALACDNRPFMAQEAMSASFGRDIRMQMVGHECAAAVVRTSTTSFKANASRGGRMSSFTPTTAMMDMAQQCMKLFQADFAGIDLLIDADNQPVFCEINSNAHIVNISQATGADVAGRILEYCQAAASPMQA